MYCSFVIHLNHREEDVETGLQCSMAMIHISLYLPFNSTVFWIFAGVFCRSVAGLKNSIVLLQPHISKSQFIMANTQVANFLCQGVICSKATALMCIQGWGHVRHNSLQWCCKRRESTIQTLRWYFNNSINPVYSCVRLAAVACSIREIHALSQCGSYVLNMLY